MTLEIGGRPPIEDQTRPVEDPLDGTWTPNEYGIFAAAISTTEMNEVTLISMVTVTFTMSTLRSISLAAKIAMAREMLLAPSWGLAWTPNIRIAQKTPSGLSFM